MALSDLINQCGNGKVPGTKQRMYYVPKGDITTFASASSTSAYGDAKIYDNDFTLGSGKKWLQLDILVNTGDAILNMKGDTGGRFLAPGVTFFVPGFDGPQLQFADDVVAYDGCLIFMIQGKNGKIYGHGDLENPCYIETLTGGVGGVETTKLGVAYKFFADTGFSQWIYDGAIDLTA